MTRITVDFRFIEIEKEIWAVGEYLKTVSSQTNYLIDQDRIRTEAMLKEAGATWDDADTQLEFQDMHERALTVFPRFMRAPCITAIWACYESGTIELADYVAKSTNKKLRLRDVRGDHFLDAAVKYYSTVLATPLDESDDRIARLKDLMVLRNAVAHANGLARAVPPDKWKAVEELARRRPNLSIEDGYVNPSEEYLQEAYSDMSSSLRALVLRVRGGPTMRVLGAA
jgi:hypothetical protein